MAGRDSSGKVGWIAALGRRYLIRPSVLALVAANLLPLYGVLYWGWDLFPLMTVYWMETGIIGFWTVVRMTMAAKWATIMLVPFFIVHFGGFMAGHFFFLWVLFAGDYKSQVAGLQDFIRVVVLGTGLWSAFIALFISHGISFFINVLQPYRKRRAAGGATPTEPESADKIMMSPYGRVFVLHATIIFGAWLIAIFDTRVAAFVLLIALKILVDVVAHVRKNFAPAPAA